MNAIFAWKTVAGTPIKGHGLKGTSNENSCGF